MNHHFYNWINKTLSNLFSSNTIVSKPPRAIAQVVDCDNKKHHNLVCIKVNTGYALTKIELHSPSRIITIVVNRTLGMSKLRNSTPDVPEGITLDARNSIPVLMQNSKYNLMVTLTAASSELGFNVELASADTADLDLVITPRFRHGNTKAFL